MPPTHTDEGLRAALELAPARARRWRSWCSPSTSRSATPPTCSAPAAEGVGYLLKDRVADVGEFLDAVRRVAAGGTAIDPEVVAQLLGRRRRATPLDDAHAARARGARADGRGPHQRRRSPQRLVVTDGAVEKHVRNDLRQARPAARPTSTTAACSPS